MILGVKLKDIIAFNNEQKLKTPSNCNLAVIGNITMYPFKDYVEYAFRKNNLSPEIDMGDYDNIIQDSVRYCDHDYIFIFYELGNLISDFVSRVNSNTVKTDEFYTRVCADLNFIFNKLAKVKNVFFQKFSSLPFLMNRKFESKYDDFVKSLNDYYVTNKPKNFITMDLSKVCAQLSNNAIYDMRYWQSTKSYYTALGLAQLAEMSTNIIKKNTGKVLKVLVVDCDNTLWKGILGEDGIDNIKIYTEIQFFFKELIANGVLFCVVSKNDHNDVIQVFEKKEMPLSLSDVTLFKVNWEPKSFNIKEIADELNLGTSSFLFVDDSLFECEEVASVHKDIEYFHVPEKYDEYISRFEKIIDNYNFATDLTKEDLKKTELYKTELKRTSHKSEFNTIEDYLISLNLKIDVRVADADDISRVAQLTQKTNQFNLTTKRYTEAQIQTFLDSSDAGIYLLQVEDKFGDYGIVGLCIIIFKPECHIDTFLMSCRVMGRSVEFKFLDTVMRKYITEKRPKEILAFYKKTEKNHHVKDFFEHCGFVLNSEGNEEKVYSVRLSEYAFTPPEFIKIKEM
jgi:FkbH-like protein